MNEASVPLDALGEAEEGIREAMNYSSANPKFKKEETGVRLREKRQTKRTRSTHIRVSDRFGARWTRLNLEGIARANGGEERGRRV